MFNRPHIAGRPEWVRTRLNVARRAAAGEEAFIRMVSEGHAEVWEDGCSFVRTQRTIWSSHLADGTR